MYHLFEQGDLLNSPYEEFIFDTSIHLFPVRVHWHYYMEMLYIIQGEVVCSCADDTYVLKEGDLICFPPRALHGISQSQNYNGIIKYHVLKFNLGRFHENADCMLQLNQLIMQAGSSKYAPIVFSKQALKHYPIEEYFKALNSEYSNRPYGYNTVMHATITQLLMSIVRIWRSLGFRPSTMVDQPEDNAIDTITEYIDAHSHQPLLVEDLATRCNMSYSFFAKKFKQLYGRSCKEYIEFIRITKAADMLLFTDNDLSFISQETGFSDSSHMIKTFKKYKQITPKQYRLQNTKSR